MFHKTITVYNRLGANWYPTVIGNVQMVMDRAIIMRTFGEGSQNSAIAHVLYQPVNDKAIVAGKEWLPPKKYVAENRPLETVTFRSGENFDFVIFGDMSQVLDIVADSAYGINGFYNYCLKTYDGVYAITSVTKYDLLPHFEIGVK